MLQHSFGVFCNKLKLDIRHENHHSHQEHYPFGSGSVLRPRRMRLVDPQPVLLPRDVQVHGDGDRLAAVVHLADLCDVELKLEMELGVVGFLPYRVRVLNCFCVWVIKRESGEVA